MVLTGQCAPLVNIIANLIKDEYLHPAYVTLYVINGKHNGESLADAIKNILTVCQDNNASLVINEFNSYGSMEKNVLQWVDQCVKPVNCGTTYEFKTSLKTLAGEGNKLAKSIINYGILIPFFLLGLVLVVRDRNRTGIMLAMITMAYFVMRTYLGGNERTRLAVEPFIVVLAFYGIMWIVSRLWKTQPAEETQD